VPRRARRGSPRHRSRCRRLPPPPHDAARHAARGSRARRPRRRTAGTSLVPRGVRTLPYRAGCQGTAPPAMGEAPAWVADPGMSASGPSRWWEALRGGSGKPDGTSLAATGVQGIAHYGMGQARARVHHGHSRMSGCRRSAGLSRHLHRRRASRARRERAPLPRTGSRSDAGFGVPLHLLLCVRLLEGGRRGLSRHRRDAGDAAGRSAAGSVGEMDPRSADRRPGSFLRGPNPSPSAAGSAAHLIHRPSHGSCGACPRRAGGRPTRPPAVCELTMVGCAYERSSVDHTTQVRVRHHPPERQLRATGVRARTPNGGPR
jgi:hypothetical protein